MDADTLHSRGTPPANLASQLSAGLNKTQLGVLDQAQKLGWQRKKYKKRMQNRARDNPSVGTGHISGSPFQSGLRNESWWSPNQGSQAASWTLALFGWKESGWNRGGSTWPSFLAYVTCCSATPPPAGSSTVVRSELLLLHSIIMRYVARAARKRWQECQREAAGNGPPKLLVPR